MEVQGRSHLLSPTVLFKQEVRVAAESENIIYTGLRKTVKVCLADSKGTEGVEQKLFEGLTDALHKM